jgi:hypothetical protein
MSAGSIVCGTARWCVSFPDKHNIEESMNMKKTISWIVAGLVLAGAATVSLAQNGPGPGPRGSGYGGPPQSPEERAARQYNCPQKSGDGSAVCPNGGGQCRNGQGNGQGNGHGYRRGLRDGTGPRNASGPGAGPNAAAGRGQ